MKKPFQIAIDGPVAAGKGTVAKLVAGRLEFLYVDTGAIYRSLTLLAVRDKVDWTSEERMVTYVKEVQPLIELSVPTSREQDGRLSTVRVNGEDISWLIRTEEISHAVSPVAQYKAVRTYVTERARTIAGEQSVVMEGRDITSVILPDADLKIYMDANPLVRARRRHAELLTRGSDVSFETVYHDLLERDTRDKRENLIKVPGVWMLDTTTMTIEQVVNTIVARVAL
jgi:CMP/dCMP kinase